MKSLSLVSIQIVMTVLATFCLVAFTPTMMEQAGSNSSTSEAHSAKGAKKFARKKTRSACYATQKTRGGTPLPYRNLTYSCFAILNHTCKPRGNRYRCLSEIFLLSLDGTSSITCKNNLLVIPAKSGYRLGSSSQWRTDKCEPTKAQPSASAT